MDWSMHFNELGGFTGQSFEDPPANNGSFATGDKRPYSTTNEAGYGKKMKTEYSSDNEWGGYGQASTGGYNQSDYSSWDNLAQSNNTTNDTFAGLSEITSWDQIMSKPKRGATSGSRGRGGQQGGFRNRGGSRGAGRDAGGGSGGSGGSGQFGGNESGAVGDFNNGASSRGGRGRGGYTRGGSSGGGFGGRGGSRGGGSGGYGNNNQGGFGRQNSGGGFAGGRGGRGQSRGSYGAGRGGYSGRGGYNSGGYNAGLSMVEKFEKYCQFLRGEHNKVNSIQSLENACTCTNMGLRTSYTVEELPKIYNRSIFSGVLKISDIFLARCVGGNKKEMKHEVYNQAYKVLTKKTITDINELKDPGIDLVRACVERQLKLAGPFRYQEGTGVPVHQTVADMIAAISKTMDTMALLQSGLVKLQDYLKMTPNLPDSPISQVEQGIMASKCGITHLFKITPKTIEGKPLFEGEFFVDDTCIARAADSNRKQVKINTYNAALEALLNKSVLDLVIPVTAQEDTDTEQIHEENEAIVSGVTMAATDGPAPITKSTLKEAPLTDRLRNLINVMSSSAYSENTTSLINNSICNSGLTSTTLFKKATPESTECSICEFYIDGYLISTGYGTGKFLCEIDAYNTGYETLVTSSPESIMMHHTKLQPDDTTGPLVLDVSVKGAHSAKRDSNKALLMRLFGSEEIDPTVNIGDMVLVEKPRWQEDRAISAFSILQYSCTLNRMLLEWTYEPVTEASQRNYKHEARPVSKFLVKLFIKGMQVGYHSGYGKNKIRNFAAWEYLGHLYTTNSVVKEVPQDDTKVWIPFVMLKSEADILRKSSPSLKSSTVNKGLDDFVVTAIKKKIDSSFPNKVGKELVFGPGIPTLERAEIRAYVQSKKLRFIPKFRDRDYYFKVDQNLDLKDLAATLKSKPDGAMFGKYMLVKPEELAKLHELVDGKKQKHWMH